MAKNSEVEAISRGFPPVVGRSPRVLILGSLPGRASLAAGQYYAQPRNAFWTIMGALGAAGPEVTYARRVQALKRAGIALWDVLLAAERPGSLDSSIVAGTQEVNDVAGLLARYPGIGLVAFNGRKAAEIFARYIESDLDRQTFESVTLPSTSPAYASLRHAQKLELWRRALLPHMSAV